MKKRLLIITCLVLPLIAFAQEEPGHFALFDFEGHDDALVLVVAMQSEQAFDVVRSKPGEVFNLEALRERGELLAAFVSGRVNILQGSETCVWEPAPDPVPATLLEVHAEGITVRGELRCPEPGRPFMLRTDLFVDGYPDHHNIVRALVGEGFHTLGSLDAGTRDMTVDLSVFSADRALKSPTPAFNIIIVIAAAAAAGLVMLLLFRKTKHAGKG
jgi:hypothetical protein